MSYRSILFVAAGLIVWSLSAVQIAKAQEFDAGCVKGIDRDGNPMPCDAKPETGRPLQPIDPSSLSGLIKKSGSVGPAGELSEEESERYNRVLVLWDAALEASIRGEMQNALSLYRQALATGDLFGTESTVRKNMSAIYVILATDAWYRGELNLALHWLDEGISNDPANTEMPYMRRGYQEVFNVVSAGLDSSRRTDWQIAAYYYHQALALEDLFGYEEMVRVNLVHVYGNLAREAWISGEYKTALSWLEKALKIDPDNQRVNDMIAAISRAQSQNAQAPSPEGFFKRVGTSVFGKGTASTAPVSIKGRRPALSAGLVNLPTVRPGQFSGKQPPASSPTTYRRPLKTGTAKTAAQVKAQVKAAYSFAEALEREGHLGLAFEYQSAALQVDPDCKPCDEAWNRLLARQPLGHDPTRSSAPNGLFIDGLMAVKADYVLNALEFGQDDWQASIKYLKDMERLFPHSRPVKEALAEVQKACRTDTNSRSCN